MNDDKTIFAPASAAGKGGVAVFRISGKDASKAITQLCSPANMPSPRVATVRLIKHPVSGNIVDRALVLFFAEPHSFTGEDVVELHIHGGRAVCDALIQSLQALPLFRLANAGEFSRRAFENGKMDLTEAEAVADLVNADTDAQRKQALNQMAGALGSLYEGWRRQLSHSLAYMEAAIDFSDEELPSNILTKQSDEIAILRDVMRAHLNDNHRGERLRDGYSIALVGPPNAGKSTLLNALARRDVAIVSSIPGTTRDIVEVCLDIKGFPVTLSDTAGLRESDDEIESEGVRRARMRAAQADLTLLVFDGAAWPVADATTASLANGSALHIVNKADLLEPDKRGAAEYLFVSAKDGYGINDLMDRMGAIVEEQFLSQSGPPLTRARHRAALEECIIHLDRSLNATGTDLRAEDVRLAMRSLGRITGRVDVEDILDIIFKDFCIGK